MSRYETVAFPDGHPRVEANLTYAERIVKFLLWARGGWKVTIGGPREHRRAHRAGSTRRTARAVSTTTSWANRSTSSRSPWSACAADEVPPRERERPAAGPPPGWLPHRLRPGRLRPQGLGGDRRRGDLQRRDRLGAGRADRSGLPLRRIIAALKLAQCEAAAAGRHRRQLGRRLSSTTGRWSPRCSAASRPSASTKSATCSCASGDELGVPLEVVNDGDVTALAGSMSLEDNGVLGIAMGSSEAAGYVNRRGRDHRLAERAGLCAGRLQPGRAGRRVVGRRRAWARSTSRSSASSAWRRRSASSCPPTPPAEKLKHVQGYLEAGHARRDADLGEHRRLSGLRHRPLRRFLRPEARAHPGPRHLRPRRRADPGRRQGGAGRRVPRAGAARINIQLPDEKSRRVGQSIAAASLPAME